MNHHSFVPKPLFDTLSQVQDFYKTIQLTAKSTDFIASWLAQCLQIKQNELPSFTSHDYKISLNFLYSYRGSADTFNSYRREIERLLQWSWFVKRTSIIELTRADIEMFVEFCQKPDKNWIGTKTLARFHEVDGLRLANPEWRPFIVKVNKKAHQDGRRPNKNNYSFSQQGLKSLFAILGSFYQFLLQEELTTMNPVAQIRQKSKFLRKQQQKTIIRRLSVTQWQCVIKTAEQMAIQNPQQHERTYFIMSTLYAMYLRISELVSSQRWQPKMSDFYRDTDGSWWFRTVGKGNKLRQIAVSDEMLAVLKRYRKYLQLPALPSPDEQYPLVTKLKNQQSISSTRAISNIVQTCFDQAVLNLQQQNLPEEAELLRAATVHWLRHTGISDDVQHRPREHVRDDAGHGSSAITDRYIDVELKKRHESARKKIIVS